MNDEKKEYQPPTVTVTLLSAHADFLDLSGEKIQNDPFSSKFGESF